MSRCKDANCNAVLKPYEIIWDAEKGEHEPFCSKCRARETDDNDIEQIIDDIYLCDVLNIDEL